MVRTMPRRKTIRPSPSLIWLWIFAVALSGNSGLRAQDQKVATPTPSVKVGDMAPDFTMVDQNGKKVTLSSFRGKKNVALAFYVFAFTDD